MAIYVKRFKNNLSYENFINSDKFVLPNVSYIHNESDDGGRMEYHAYYEDEAVYSTMTLYFNATQDNLLAFSDTINDVKKITVDGNEIELGEPVERKFVLRPNETFDFLIDADKLLDENGMINDILIPLDFNSEIIIKPTNDSDIEKITEIVLVGYVGEEIGFYFQNIDKCEEDGIFTIVDRDTLTLSFNPAMQMEFAAMGSKLCYCFASEEVVGTTISMIYQDTTVTYNTADIIYGIPGYDLSITPIDENMTFTNDTIVTLYLYNNETDMNNVTYNGPISNSILNDIAYATVSDKEIIVNKHTIDELSTMGVFISFTFTNPDGTPLLVNYSYDMSSSCLEQPLYFDSEGEHTITIELNGSVVNTFVNLNQNTLVGCEMQGVTKIGNMVFTNCESLEFVDFGDTLEEIGDYEFNGCYLLNNVTFPNTLKSIGINAFRYCTGWTGELILPENLEYIGDQAFYNCSGLTNTLVIPDLITNIEYCTFYQCGISSLVLPENLTSIGEIAFQGCRNLTSITCNAMVAPTIQSNTFRYLPNYGTLYYPEGATGYEAWLSNDKYYLGYYGWTSQTF